MKSINFFYDQNQHFLDKFVTWSLSYGRTIVMITELIALCAFLYRFGLDQSMANLHDQITQEQTIVTASKDIEANFRNLQNRLSLASQLTNQATQQVLYVTDTIDQSKGNVTFQSIEESSSGIKIQVSALNATALNTFVDDLRNDSHIATVNIDSIQAQTGNEQLDAAMSLTLR